MRLLTGLITDFRLAVPPKTRLYPGTPGTITFRWSNVNHGILTQVHIREILALESR